MTKSETAARRRQLLAAASVLGVSLGMGAAGAQADQIKGQTPATQTPATQTPQTSIKGQVFLKTPADQNSQKGTNQIKGSTADQVKTNTSSPWGSPAP